MPSYGPQSNASSKSSAYQPGSLIGLREVDVGGKACVARALNQVEKGCTFGGARAAPDYDDDSVMRLDPREPKEVIPIAGDENAARS